MKKNWIGFIMLLAIGLVLYGCIPAASHDNEPNILWPDLIQEDFYTFSDGNSVDIYMHGKDDRDPKYYRLEDGSVILTELMSFAHFDILDYEREDYSFDENDPFLQLPIDTQHKILAYYKELGTLYDLEAELENAYLLYKRQIEAGDTYWTGESDADGVIRNQSPGVYQNTSEAGHNDSIICFYTDMQKPMPAALQLEHDNEYFMPEITGGFYGLYTVFDVSTGDAITPHAVQYNFSEIFDDEKSYELWAYNIETVMAEKVETILRRGVFNTRPRDFYDAYILATTQKFDKALFAEALAATAAHRGTTEQIADIPTIMKNIEESPELRTMWDKYRKQFAYAENIPYESVLAELQMLIQ